MESQNREMDEYSNLSDYYHFVSVNAGTFGAFGPQIIMEYVSD